MLTRKQKLDLLRKWREAKRQGLTRKEFAASHGLTTGVLNNAINRAKAAEQYEKRHPDIVTVDLGEPWEFEGDWCIVGDVHIPTTDYGFASLIAPTAKKILGKNPRLLIAGDLWNFDSLSYYDDVIDPPSALQELRASRALINDWLETFSSIDIIMGNHDRRWQRWALKVFGDDPDDESSSAESLIAMVKADPSRLRLSQYGYCTIQSGGERWIVMHQKNYSINQLTVADVMAAKERCNVITFHEHHLALGWDRYGHNIVINGGCLADAGATAYKALDKSKHAAWKLGFVILKNGCPYVFGEYPFTDWSQWQD